MRRRSLGEARLVLIADDLTGALDAAAELTGAFGPVRVGWNRANPPRARACALDVATREKTADEAAAALREAGERLDAAGADCVLHKVDSLLRGHAGAELDALMSAGGFSCAVIAPAFPFQRRVTRGGRQWAPGSQGWRATGEALALTLAARGRTATLALPGAPAGPGVTLYDAETDVDLDRIVAAGLASGERILWCGSGGLAGALARAFGAPVADQGAVETPALGLFGSDHPVTAAQLARAGALALRLPDGDPDAVARALAGALQERGVALFAYDLPDLPRKAAARRIAQGFAAIAERLPRPRTLLAGGGETLRALADALGAEALDVEGRVVPGVPRARFVGGRWGGLALVSKSGAFGDEDFLARLLAPHSSKASRP